jgi:hypothetical protein
MRADAHSIDYKSHDRPLKAKADLAIHAGKPDAYVCKQGLDLLNEVFNFAVSDPA